MMKVQTAEYRAKRLIFSVSKSALMNRVRSPRKVANRCRKAALTDLCACNKVCCT